MRHAFDRLRQAISFELIGLLIVIPLGSALFGFHIAEFGALAVVAATLATGWHYVYNLLFDHGLRRWQGHTQKSLRHRVVHALGFEGGLLMLLLPVMAYWLGISLFQALVMDLSFALFYTLYAFVFTWIYDRIFPVPAPA